LHRKAGHVLGSDGEKLTMAIAILPLIGPRVAGNPFSRGTVLKWNVREEADRKSGGTVDLIRGTVAGQRFGISQSGAGMVRLGFLAWNETFADASLP
jgi:hypothetical protein